MNFSLMSNKAVLKHIFHYHFILWTSLINYRHVLKCGYLIDVPVPEYKSVKNYQGTLGHKINHSFEPNCKFIHFYDTPR